MAGIDGEYGISADGSKSVKFIKKTKTAIEKAENGKEKEEESSEKTKIIQAKRDIAAYGIKEKEEKNKEYAKLKKRRNKYKHDNVILSITVHCMDRTEGLPVLLSHPVVEVFIVDANEGSLLKKSSRKRKVTSFYEDENVTEILPLMTQPYNIQEKKNLFCQWEEALIFNESLNYIKESESEVIFFFHLKDFGSIKSNNSIKKKSSSNSDWKTFAWAFLKFASSSGQENVGKKLQLQLYRPRRLLNVKLTDLYSWWKSGSRRKYNTSLHITAQGVTLPSDPVPSLRSKLPNQKEIGNPNCLGSQLELINKVKLQGDPSTASAIEVEWDRKKNEKCEVPNRNACQLSSMGQGCMVVKFSNSGLKLACGTQQCILIYDVLTGFLSCCLRGHLGLVYSLEWSIGDRHLVSSSADSTVRVWDFKDNSEYFMNVLTHPSFVYVAKFYPEDHTVVVSGCFDHILRVWILKDKKYVVLKEFNVHLGYISSIAFDPDGSFMYSADKQGVLAKWKVSRGKNIGENSYCLRFLEILKLKDIHGIPINHITFHPNKYRILLQSKDSCIRLVNIINQTTTQKLQGILNTKELIKSCISPCGSWVISGSEDSSIAVWDSETGELFSRIFDLPFESTISCVDFHPFAHMIAICSYAEQTAIVLMKFDKSTSDVDVRPKSMQKSALSKQQYPSVSMEAKNIQSQDEKSVPLRDDSMESQEHWKEIGKNLLRKLDFILKAASDGSAMLDEREKTEEELHEAEALYSFKSTAADEASLQRGECVKIIKEDNSGWWLVEKDNGVRGLVPSNHLKYIIGGSHSSMKLKKKYKMHERGRKMEKSLMRRRSLSEMTGDISNAKTARLRRQRTHSEDV